MKRFVIGKLAVVLTVGTFALAAGEAKAQFIKFGPNGEVGIQNWMGTYSWVHPSRFNPGANQPVPGTTQLAPNGLGIIYQGQDGLPHGTVLDPSTGDFHTFSNKNSSGAGNKFKGFLEESGSAKSPHAATPNKTASGPQTNQWKSPRVQNWGGTKSNPQTLNRNLQGYRSTYRSR